MRRREFITALGGAAAWPLVARAQQGAMPVVGFLHSASPNALVERFAAFQGGLSDAGFVAGQNVAIQDRWADNNLDNLPALAADLVRQRSAVIAAVGNPRAALATRSVTAIVPIVFVFAADPVKLGLVASLNRPGGNVTGITNLGAELVTKRLGLLRELVPRAELISVLVNPSNPSFEVQLSEAQAAARALGLQLHIAAATNRLEIDLAFAAIKEQHAAALLVTSDGFFVSQHDYLVGLAARHPIPTIYEFREFPAAGGLMSYGTNVKETYRQAGHYSARILKGEKPGDLPVVQPTRFEFVINLKTAKALGLTVPPGILAIADEVIE
jgi:putative ABC transport system substrate-binding protein